MERERINDTKISMRKSRGFRHCLLRKLGKKTKKYGTIECKRPSQHPTKQFTMFECLPDEVQCRILSFVATGPFSSFSTEDTSIGESTLTQTLPLVSRKFQRHCHANSLWESALSQAVDGNDQWRLATQRLFDIDPQAGKVGSPRNFHLLKSPCLPPYRMMYQVILQKGVRVEAPVFVSMEFRELPLVYRIALNEPRYRLMMTKLINEENQKRRSRQTSLSNNLQFLHVTGGRLLSVKDLSQVQVQLVQILSYDVKKNCDIHVVVKKLADVRVEHCCVQPQSKGLLRAHGLRLREFTETE